MNVSKKRPAGILFYRTTPLNNVEILLQHRQYKKKGTYYYWYEDLGGKMDKCDKTIYDTAIREASEESNCAFVISKIPIDILKLL